MEEFDSHSRTGGHFVGGFLSARSHFDLEECPVFRLGAISDIRDPAYLPAARSWISQAGPEVILAPSDFIFSYLKDWGLRVPKDISFASLALGITENDDYLSGIDQNNKNIGRSAVNLLVAMLERQETGVPETPTHLLIDGFWRAGLTAVPQKKPRKRKLPEPEATFKKASSRMT